MEKPPRTFWQIWNMSFGFLGIQFGWGLQMANMSAIYEYLGARADQIPILWLAAPLTGLIVQPIIGHAAPHLGPLGRRRPYFSRRCDSEFDGAQPDAAQFRPSLDGHWFAVGFSTPASTSAYRTAMAARWHRGCTTRSRCSLKPHRGRTKSRAVGNYRHDDQTTQGR